MKPNKLNTGAGSIEFQVRVKPRRRAADYEPIVTKQPNPVLRSPGKGAFNKMFPEQENGGLS
jgi:hypothetical protein